MAPSDKAESHINRLLEDRELQDDLRELLAAVRGSFDRAAAKRRRPARLFDDRKFRQQTQRAAASLKNGSAHLRGESPSSYRGRRIVGVLLAVGGVALAVREVLREPGPDAPWG
jgi:hypothetical protein